MDDRKNPTTDSQGRKDYQRAVQDLSSHARVVSAKQLKGRVKVITKDDIRRIVNDIIDSYKGLSNKDLMKKISEYELMIENMKNSSLRMKGNLDQALEDRDVLISEMEKLKKQLARALDNRETEETLKALQWQLKKAEENIRAKDGMLSELEEQLKNAAEALASSRDSMESKDRRIRELEEIAAQSDLTARVAELQRQLQEMEEMYEAKIKKLEAYIWDLEVALEFVDAPQAVDMTELTVPMQETEDLIQKFEPVLSEKFSVESAERLMRVTESIRKNIRTVRSGCEKLAGLITEMEGGSGTIAVVNEIENIYSRHKWAVDDFRRTNTMLIAFMEILNID